MSDVAIAIGIDASAAKTGRDQIIGWNGEIAASYAAVLKAARGAGMGFNAQSMADQARAAAAASAAYAGMQQSITSLSGETSRLNATVAAMAATMEKMAASQNAWAQAAQAAGRAAGASAQNSKASAQAAETEAQATDRIAQRIRDASAAREADAAKVKQQAAAQEALNRATAQAAGGIASNAGLLSVGGAQQAKEATAAMERLTQARRDDEAAAAANIASADKLVGRYAPMIRAQQQLANDRAAFTKIQQEGTLAASEEAAVLSGLEAKQRSLDATQKALGSSTKAQAQHFQNLKYQLNDVISGLIMGQPPMMVFTQQGGQIIQALDGMDMSLSKVKASTWALAGVTVATVATLATIAFRMASITNEAKQLNTITSVLNPNLGATAEQLRAISFAVADQGTSRATGMAALTAVIRDTRIQSAGLAEQIAKVSVNVAAVMGGEVPDWAKKIGEAAATGSQGFDKLLSTLPGITAETMKAVRAAEQHGDRLGASKIAVDALEKQYGGSAKAMKSAWDESVDEMIKSFDKLVERVSSSSFVNDFVKNNTKGWMVFRELISGPDISAQFAEVSRDIVSAQKRLEEVSSSGWSWDAGGGLKIGDKAISAAQARVDALRERFKDLQGQVKAAEQASAAPSSGGSIGGLNENELNKLNLAVEATKRQALASDLLSKNLSVTARAAAENRIALADMAMQYPALGAGTAKSILESRDFAATLKTLPPELQNVFKAMQNNSANKLAGDVAQAGVALSSAAYAAKMHAEAAGMGEAAMRAASIEAEVYAHRMDGTADAVRASLDEQERYVRAGIQQEFEQGINRQIEANDRLIAAYGVSGKAVEDATRYNEAYLQTLKEYPESMKNLPAYEDLWTAALNRNIGKLKERDLSKQAKDVAAYAEKIKAAQEDLSIDRAAAGMSDLAALDLKARYDALKAMNYTIERYGALNDAARQQVNIQLDAAASLAKQQQEVKNYEDAWGVALGSVENGMGKVGDAAIQVAVEGKSAAISFGSLWKGIFTSIMSDLARLGAVDVKRLLGLGGNTQGSLLDLFGGSSSPQSPLTGQAANQNGGLLNNASSLSSIFTSSGGSLSPTLDAWAQSTLGFGQVSNFAGQSATAYGPFQASSGLLDGGSALSGFGSLSNILGIGGAILPGLLSGNIGQAASGGIGAAIGTAILPGIGTALGGLAGNLLGGLFGPKPSVGPNAQGNVVVENGRFAEGPSAADNGGDVGPVKQATAQIAAQFNALIDSFGLKTTGQNFGFFTGGDKVTGNGVKSVDDLVKAITAGGVTGTGLVGQALQSDKVKSLTSVQDIAGYLQLAKSIEDATAGLASLDKSLAGIAASAKKAAADTYKAVDDELAKAGDIGLSGQYKAALAGQIRSTFEGAAQSWTPMETAMAQVKGQTDALVEAVARWGLSITEAEIRADAAAKVEKLRTQALAEYDAAMRTAQGRDYLTQIGAIRDSEESVRRNLAAVGVADAASKASALIAQQASAALSGLDIAQLADAARSLTGTFSDLARELLTVKQASASLSVERAINPDRAMTASDLFVDAGISAKTAWTNSGFPAQLDAFFSAAQQGAVSANDLRLAAAYLNTELVGGKLSAEQYNSALSALTQSYSNSGKAATDAAAAVKTANDNARSSWLSVVSSSLQAAQSVASQWSSLRDSLHSKILSNLVGEYSPLSPLEQFQEAQKQFRDLLAVANDSTPNDAESLKAAGQLAAAGDAYLKANKDYWASANPAAFKEVQDGLGAVETVAERQLSLAQKQVDYLSQMADALKALDATLVEQSKASSILSTPRNWGAAAQVTTNLQLALKTGYSGDFGGGGFQSWITQQSDPVKATARDVLTQMGQSWRINGFASGTPAAPPGWAWVGERGPELMPFAGGEPVIPNAAAVAMASRWEEAASPSPGIHQPRWSAANDRWGGVAEFRPASRPESRPSVDVKGIERRLDDMIDLHKAAIYETLEQKAIIKKQAAEITKLRAEAADRGAPPRRTGTYGQR